MNKSSTAQLVALTSLVMVAFATNSLLCREALASNLISVADFTTVRLISGALTLWFCVAIKNKDLNIGGTWLSAGALFGYAACFSIAYTSLSAGTGALLLFGSVQISMISWGLIHGERFTALKWIGVLSAFSGLIWFVSPGVEAPPFVDAILMIAGGIFWGVYSLRGRGVTDPTKETAGNFIRSLPMVAILYILPIQNNVTTTPVGWYLAMASGALASGLGYALWYSIIPKLTPGTSATVQLSVPIIASIGGIVFLAEPFTYRLAIASLVILGGICLFINSARRV